MRRDLIIVALMVLALRVPFLNQPIQGDDVYYLYGAEHALVDPLHPLHARYAFLGQMVDMRGHPHGPFNSWFLALLLSIFKDVYEIPFHAAYVLFSLIAALSALALARRFTSHPLAATLVFLATPALVVNGNSLEADVPFLAFWLLSMALFLEAVERRSIHFLVASSVAMALASLTAYQAILLLPILWLYGRKWRTSWIALATPPLVFVAWQLFERLSSGALPATVLAGYMQSYHLQQFVQKLKNAVALTGHLGWIVFPTFWLPPLAAIPAAIGAAFYDVNPLFWGSIAIGAGILVWCVRNWRDFLAQWVLIFFAGALVIFFAGSARYLLPIALPVAILATRHVSPRWRDIGFGCGLALSLGFAIVNYQHWNAYRQVASTLRSEISAKRVWINGEWGLRYYLESEGAVPLLQSDTPRAGDLVVSSSLGYAQKFNTAGATPVTTLERIVTSPIPLRLVALNGKSAYSTTMFGLRPFDVSLGPIDRVTAETLVEHKPTLTNLPMSAPEADSQIVSGVYQLENGKWRWMSQTATILLKPPAQPTPLVLHLFIPENAPARRVTIDLNGQRIASQDYPGPGTYTLASGPQKPDGETVTVVISVDKSIPLQLDRRQLGIILTEVGFTNP